MAQMLCSNIPLTSLLLLLLSCCIFLLHLLMELRARTLTWASAGPYPPQRPAQRQIARSYPPQRPAQRQIARSYPPQRPAQRQIARSYPPQRPAQRQIARSYSCCCSPAARPGGQVIGWRHASVLHAPEGYAVLFLHMYPRCCCCCPAASTYGTPHSHMHMSLDWGHIHLNPPSIGR